MSDFDAVGEPRQPEPAFNSDSTDAAGKASPAIAASLRPMSLGEILDRAVQIIRSRFLLFVGIAAFPALATLLHTLVSEPAVRRGFSDDIAWKVAAPLLSFIFWVANVILSALASAAQCRAASEILLGRPVNISSAYGAFSDRKARLVGLQIWQALLAFWPAFPMALLLVAMAKSEPIGNPWLVYGSMAVVVGIPCAFLYTRYALAFPATAILDETARESIDRSVELGRDFRWKVFWSFALPAGIGMVLLGGVSGVLDSLGKWLHLTTTHPLLLMELDAIWTFVASVFYEPLTSIAITLTYYDLCVRKEGFDIVRMLQQSGLEAEPVAAPESILGLGSLAPRPAAQNLAPSPAESPGETS